jgi:threonine aldolase
MAAERLGKEAGLFVASGTMGNLSSVLAHCGRGDEVILGDQAHILMYEQGGTAALGGIHPRAVPTQPDGTLDLDDVKAAIRGDNQHFPITRLVAIENTQNRRGGTAIGAAYMSSLGALAREHGIRIHIDGARIFNAAVALGVEAKELVADADSVTFCLSKALGAPIGSVVCGSREFISRVFRARKVLGGGMRQVGVIAAAGIVALERMVERLADDHANAAKLAAGLAEMEGILVEEVPVRTNMVYFRVERDDISAEQLAEKMTARGVRMLPLDPTRIRLVTNYHVSSDDIDTALAVFGEVLS